MALIAEEVVEEWLNRKGYFTIRGIKLGVQEMDILAVKFEDGKADLRHYEVQASVNPVGHICPAPKAIQESEHLLPHSAKRRSAEVLSESVCGWVEKKFKNSRKEDMRNRLMKGEWSFYFVVGNVAFPEELELIGKSEVSVVQLQSILNELKSEKPEFTASGKDLVDLMLMDHRERKRH